MGAQRPRIWIDASFINKPDTRAWRIYGPVIPELRVRNKPTWGDRGAAYGEVVEDKAKGANGERWAINGRSPRELSKQKQKYGSSLGARR